MTSAVALTADTLLSIPPTTPERLFTADEAVAKQEYRRLAACWHPDLNPDPRAKAVFQHLSELYRVATAKLRSGTWKQSGLLELEASDGSRHKIRYLRRHAFELGETYLGRTVVIHAIRTEFADLFEQALGIIAGFRFANAAMQAEIARTLPAPAAVFATRDRLVLMIDKAPDLVRLDDLVGHQGGRLDPKHVAWVLSTLYNLLCYLDYAGLAHHAIGPDSYYVAPERHAGALLGGWWYAGRIGARLIGLPERSLELAPAELLRAKSADARLDLELVRAIGRELLGDPSGARLALENAAPPPMIEWLRCSSSGTALRDYQLWRQVMKDSFGERRFVKLDVTHHEIYR